MAPIPEDNQEKLPPKDSDINSAVNPNLFNAVIDGSDSSDDEGGNVNNGYTLLPQDPEDDQEQDNENEEDAVIITELQNGNDGATALSTNTNGATNEEIQGIQLPDKSTMTEPDMPVPTVSGSSAKHHPEFLAKFPDGRIPSYMQVPSLPRSGENLGNQKKPDKGCTPLEPGKESTILRAMAGFSLPLENIPDWAKNMSDDQWKQQVLCNISPDQEKVTTASPTETTSPSGKKDFSSGSEAEKAKDEEWVAHFPDV